MTRRLFLGLIALLAHASLLVAADPFTIVVLPDTQEYVDRRTEKFKAREGKIDWTPYFFKQIDWIKDSKAKLNTVFVVQEGDIVQTDYEPEWEIAAKGFRQLDGVVPYVMTVGNHDIGFVHVEATGKKPATHKTAQNRESHFDKYFPRAAVEGKPWFGGSMDNTLTNAWYRFEAAGMKFMIVSLEFKPRDEAIAWANKVVAEHADHRAIIVTHGYMGKPNAADPRLTEKSYGGYPLPGNTGQQMWDKLVSKQPNIFMVLCGHVSGQQARTSKADDGREVIEILSDFQAEPLGGGSNLIYLTFDPDKHVIEGYTYNPATGQFREGPHARFTFTYPMNGK